LPVVNAPTPAAVLFDMDGTLVDSEPYWIAEETALVTAFGGTWSHDDALSLVGKGLWDSAAILQSRGVDMTADAIVAHLTDGVIRRVREHVPWLPGAQELLRSVRDAGIPTALVTMSTRGLAEVVTDAIPFPAFDVLVTGDDVPFPKPHPAPYLQAAERLGVDIEHCIAIEDSVPGVTSAVASNALTIGVPINSTLPDDAGHVRWHGLEGRSVDDLVDLMATRAGVAR
jgi:HAD superfamily hydrolase (TIGR01509 family)